MKMKNSENWYNLKILLLKLYTTQIDNKI